jgi:hypothetical protein
MKTNPKKTVRDPVVTQLVTHLKKKGVKCGYGDQITQLRKR